MVWLCVRVVCVPVVCVVCAVCGCEWHVDACAGLLMGGGCVAWRVWGMCVVRMDVCDVYVRQRGVLWEACSLSRR